MKKEAKIYIKNKNIFKNPLQMIIYCILFVVILGLFIYISKMDFHNKKDAKEELASIFDRITIDNVFIYGHASTIKNVIENGTGIVLFGTDNKWVNYYIGMVNNAAKEVGINKIYYYDFIKNKLDNNGTYESIVNKLENYVLRNDRGYTNIYAPTLLIMKDGKVIYYDDETAFVRANTKPEEYWDYYKQYSKTNEFKEAMLEYLGR